MRPLPSCSSLYVHIPFCNTICPFCDFTKLKSNDTIYQDYCDACCNEINWYAASPKIQLETIFFGGGTPSCLPIAYLKKIMKTIFDTFDCSNLKEVTIEINPEDVSSHYLTELYLLGFTRISLGVQTFDESECSFLGRGHSVKQSHNALEHIKASSFDLNIDLIFSLPDSSFETLTKSLETALFYQPNHISTYSLTIEPGTLFHKNFVQKAPNDIDFNYYSFIIEFLFSHAFTHYEISSFALDNHECIHNKRYWNFDSYIGVGLGAHSFIDPYRYSNTSQLKQYLKSSTPSYFRNDFQALPKDTLIKEHIIANLRIPNGIHYDVYKKRYNMDFEKQFHNEITNLVNQDLIQKTAWGFKTTKKGLYLLDNVCLSFL